MLKVATDAEEEFKLRRPEDKREDFDPDEDKAIVKDADPTSAADGCETKRPRIAAPMHECATLVGSDAVARGAAGQRPLAAVSLHVQRALDLKGAGAPGGSTATKAPPIARCPLEISGKRRAAPVAPRAKLHAEPLAAVAASTAQKQKRCKPLLDVKPVRSPLRWWNILAKLRFVAHYSRLPIAKCVSKMTRSSTD